MVRWSATTLPALLGTAVAKTHEENGWILRSWADNVYMESGAALSAFSWALGVNGTFEQSNASRKLPWSLPRSRYLLVELFKARSCMQCTGGLTEFERVAQALPGCGQEGQEPFLCAVSVNCVHFKSICDRYTGTHREPFGTLIHPDPQHGTHPPKGWWKVWSTSQVVLISREEFREHPWSPSYWRRDEYDTAEDLVLWIRSCLGLLKPAAKHAIGYSESVHKSWQLVSQEDFRQRVLHLLPERRDKSQGGCLCKASWQSCNGGFFGKFQSCQKRHGCSAELEQCETVNKCSGGLDGCKPGSPDVALPALSGEGPDADLAAALWLHFIFADAEFPVVAGQGKAKNNWTMTAESLEKRNTFFDFLDLLCLWYPQDRESPGAKTLDVASAAIWEEVAEANAHEFEDIIRNASGRRLWPWESQASVQIQTECREALCTLRKLLDQHWDEWFITGLPGYYGGTVGRLNVTAIEHAWIFCNRPWHAWPGEQWHQCRGTFAGTRQLPCGIWVLLHKVMARADDRIKAGRATNIFYQFVKEFFDCPVCQRHWEKAPFNSSVKTPKDAILWLWETHNFISQLMSEQPEIERAFGADPGVRPQSFWPTKALCPSCANWEPTKQKSLHMRSFDADEAADVVSTSMDWNLTEVYKFLVHFYGSGNRPESATAFLEELPRKPDKMLEPVMTAASAAERRSTWVAVLESASIAVSLVASVLLWPWARRNSICRRGGVTILSQMSEDIEGDEERERLLL
eukprot:TRINITY_DN35104_c1_g2_i1.p1 TRINITY_DN35104_c1_g2~~TRINITY_DN35104_c1_g2_i1.p1  ORF type:complete len:745 (-),score=109.98 TRINITY_DN35104_c1_g2_i1:297-2531(-)